MRFVKLWLLMSMKGRDVMSKEVAWLFSFIEKPPQLTDSHTRDCAVHRGRDSRDSHNTGAVSQSSITVWTHIQELPNEPLLDVFYLFTQIYLCISDSLPTPFIRPWMPAEPWISPVGLRTLASPWQWTWGVGIHGIGRGGPSKMESVPFRWDPKELFHYPQWGRKEKSGVCNLEEDFQ